MTNNRNRCIINTELRKGKQKGLRCKIMMNKDEIKMVEDIVKTNEMLIKILAEMTDNETIKDAIALNEEVKEKIAYKKSLNSNTNMWNGNW